MRLLYLHGSTLEAFRRTGKIRFLDALNPGTFFEEVCMVNFEPDQSSDDAFQADHFSFRSIGLARLGRSKLAKLRAVQQAIKDLATSARADLILADDANLLGFAAYRIARRTARPYALCVYYDNDLHYRLTGQPALGFLRFRGIEELLERFLFKRATGVYAQNRGYADYALRHGAPIEKTYVGTYCVDDVFYKEPVTPHPDGREIFFIGRLHPLKFIDDLLAALQMLPSHLRLDVAGTGSDRDRLEELSRVLGVADRVRFLGLVPREELIARMQAATVLLATQGFNAVIECLLSGRPVVAYDHECNAEIVRHEDTGLLVPARDVKALAQSIRRVIDDPDLGARLGRTGRERMLSELPISTSIEHRRRFFEACMARAAP